MSSSLVTAQAASDHPLEDACAFGTDSILTGVYTPALNADTSKPCALFLTAGLLHHVGPTRLHVELARALSLQGIAGLRFDLSGVGESETSSLGGYFMERSISEVTRAMDYLDEHYGHKRFVLIGLCSGADDALATAQRDERVVGLVLLNGYAYKAGWFFINRLLKFYLPRLFVWQKIRNRLSNFMRPANKAALAERAALIELDDDYRYIPPQQETADALLSLSQAETDLLFVYTGSEHDDYTYKGQLFAMFPELRNSPNVSEQYLTEADHTLILKTDRQRVIRWVCEWFASARFNRIR
ncbi:MAG: alpha/beta fold hydrolase [Granulosicoccus sp.]